MRTIDIREIIKKYIHDRAYVVGGQIVPEQEYWKIVRKYQEKGTPIPSSIRIIHYIRKIEDDPDAVW